MRRIAEFLGFRARSPENAPNGYLFANGPTVPADGSAGYAIGCLFQHTDGSAGTTFYVNEGSRTSSDFNAITSLTAAQSAYLVGLTAGTVTASKALVVDSNKDLATLRALTVERLNYTPVARTATADGLTTGTIADAGMLQFVTVTSADANHIVVLPTPTPGVIVILHVAATGYELRSSAPGSVGINGGTGAGAESAIGANTTAVLVCATATSWKGWQLGSDGTLAKVEVAA